MEDSSVACYVIVNNIPKSYRSADLRNFFSEFVETQGFSCFHYRHRPEVQKAADGSVRPGITNSTFCCLVKVPSSRVVELIARYGNKHWIGRDGQTLRGRCFLRQVLVKEDVTHISSDDSSSAEREVLLSSDIASMIEMHPPVLMPCGNVGTPTTYFLDQIRQCRLPSSIISKLGLEFPHMRAKRLYSSVNYNYGGRRLKGKTFLDANIVKTSKGVVISDNYVDQKKSGTEHEEETLDVHDCDEEEEEGEPEEEEEEWDRHESLHDDITQQERLKERLFEEKIELKWEKGGSGLVFYTDAQFWDQEEGDFDAKTADDWDLDMTSYYEPGQGDKDARDLLKMRLEKRLREGMHVEKVDANDFAGFEKFSKGFGRRVMEAQGWREGDGLGKSVVGVAEPLQDMGKHPRDKKGFGYHGEKLNRNVVHRSQKRKSDSRDDGRIRISTAFDDPANSDGPEPLLRSSPLTRLKYRKEFLKQSAM